MNQEEPNNNNRPFPWTPHQLEAIKAFQSGRNVLLTGSASGKSTVVRYLATLYSGKGMWVQSTQDLFLRCTDSFAFGPHVIKYHHDSWLDTLQTRQSLPQICGIISEPDQSNWLQLLGANKTVIIQCAPLQRDQMIYQRFADFSNAYNL